MYIPFALICLIVGEDSSGPTSSTTPPAVLKRAFEARMAITNAELCWLHRMSATEVERFGGRPKPYAMYHISKYLDHQRSWHMLGDEQGWVLQLSEPTVTHSHDPIRVVIDDQRRAAMVTSDADVMVVRNLDLKSGQPKPDARVLGLWYKHINDETPRTLFERLERRYDRYETSTDAEGVVRVGAWSSDAPNFRVIWTLEPKSGSVKRVVSIEQDSHQEIACDAEYADSSILPSRTVFTSNDEEYASMELVWSREGHLSRLDAAAELRQTPETRMFLWRQIQEPDGRTILWDGQQEVSKTNEELAVILESMPDYKAYREKADAVDRGTRPRNVLAEIFGGMFTGQVSGRDAMRLWEGLTRAFLGYYGCDSDQRKDAAEILKEAQSKGYAFLDDHKHDEDRFDERIAELRDAPEANKERKIEALRKERSRIYKPLKLIRDRELIARLMRLLTEEQKKSRPEFAVE